MAALPDPDACVAAPSAACVAALVQLPPDGPDAPKWEPLAANLAAAGHLDAAHDAAAPLVATAGDRGVRSAAWTLAWRAVAVEAKSKPGAVASFAPIERLASGDPAAATAYYSMLIRDLTGRNPAVVGGGPAWLAAAEEAAHARRRNRAAFPATLPAALDAWEAAIGRLPPRWQGARWAEFAEALVWLGHAGAARAALQAAEDAHRLARDNNRGVSVRDTMRAWLGLGEPLPAFEAALWVETVHLPGLLVPHRLAEVAEGALAAGRPEVARAAAVEAHRNARDTREGKPWIEPRILYGLIKTQAAAGDEAGARAMAEDWLRWARETGFWRASNIATAAAAYDALGDAERARAVLREALEIGAVQRGDRAGGRLRGWEADGPVLGGGDAAEKVALGLLSLGDVPAAGHLLRGLDPRIRHRVVERVFVERLVECGDGAPPLAEQAARIAAATALEGGTTGLLLAATAVCVQRGVELAVAQGLGAARAVLEMDPTAWVEWRFAFARLAATAGRRDLVGAVLSRITADALAVEHPGRRADALGVAAAHAAALLD
jgi:tetratricopeptide (TPR) repeat protein